MKGMFGGGEGFFRIVASRAGNAEALVFCALPYGFYYPVMLFPIQGRAFSCGSNGKNSRNPVLNLEFGQPGQIVKINGIPYEKG